MLIEDYSVTSCNPAKKEKLAMVEAAIKKIVNEEIFGTELKKLLPRYIANAHLIRNIYLSNDNELIELFIKYLPIPRKEIFNGDTIPSFIFERERESKKIIVNFLNRNLERKNTVKQIEDDVVRIQRLFRYKQRQREERKRISNLYHSTLQAKQINIEQALSDANTPYLPQMCHPKLARRIVKAAKKVKLFTTVRHLTGFHSIAPYF